MYRFSRAGSWAGSLLFGGVLTLTGCGGGGGSSSSTPVTTTPPVETASVAEFPVEVAVASPVDADVQLSASNVTRSLGVSRAVRPVYSTVTDRVADLLEGSASTLASSFDPEDFYRQATSAACYGPTMDWENHPDGMPPTSGEFPSGDLGIWQTTVSDTGEACAAAQLNARMDDISDRTSMALMSLASLVGVYQAAGHTWPTDMASNTTEDLTAGMNALGIANVTFTGASMSLGSDGVTWTYSLDFTYERDGTPLDIGLDLTHKVTDASAGLFEGLMTYQIENRFQGGNCGAGENPVTLNGSLHYRKSAAENVVLQARNAQACGDSATANMLTEAVNSTELTGSVVNPDESWSDNFAVFTADLNPATLLGSYSYLWQAGSGDSHTRVLDVGIESTTAGEAYFGFGKPVSEEITGEIVGFICNWAGPGGDHSNPPQYAQRQHITLNATTGVYEPTNEGASDIVYAPTNACTYDGGTFWYDRNLDNLNDGEDIVEVAEAAVVTTQLQFDLMKPNESEATIWEHILGRGYNAPNYP